ncbi:MAG: branched-chain amino acid ABC transporter permease [Actinomycetota bacterium]|nr:branched-chain amino acid ABC transporter permease [Actinomycetota bacterium]
MDLFVQLLLNGLVAGSLYALVAVGFALIFAATRHFHIAHAAVFAAGGYFAYFLADRLALGLAVAGALLLSVALGVALVTLLYRPLERRGGAGFVLFLISLGALIVIDNVFTVGLGAQPARLAAGSWFTTTVPLGQWSLVAGQVVLILVAIGLFGGLVLLLSRTRMGKLVQAFSGNPEFVQIVGRRPQVVLVVVYALGSLLAAVAGIYVAADTGMQPGLGETFFIVSVMAVIIGGIGSITGAFVAAMLLGLLQNVLLLVMGAEWTLAAIFVLFLVLITVSPQGLSQIKLRRARASA